MPHVFCFPQPPWKHLHSATGFGLSNFLNVNGARQIDVVATAGIPFAVSGTLLLICFHRMAATLVQSRQLMLDLDCRFFIGPCHTRLLLFNLCPCIFGCVGVKSFIHIGGMGRTEFAIPTGVLTLACLCECHT